MNKQNEKQPDKRLVNRDNIMFGNYSDSRYKDGSAVKFEGLTIEQFLSIKKIEGVWEILNDSPNDIPRLDEIEAFMKKYKGYTLNGLAYPTGEAIVEGISKKTGGEPDIDYLPELFDFRELVRHADWVISNATENSAGWIM